jgi:flavin reductase (DIM6/NTAB) family NADH-FMN oxidoreductase RutF
VVLSDLKPDRVCLDWATQVSFEPKLLGIGVEHPALTHELIAESGSFSLCTIDRAIVRTFTKPVEVGNHTFFIGEIVACGFQHDESTPVLRMEDTRLNYGG